MMSADNVSPLARSDLLLVLGIGAVSYVIFLVVPVLYTFVEWLFVLTHEAGHLIATILTGGETNGIWIYRKLENGKAGKAVRKGGASCLIIPAGYLGVALCSAGLMLLSNLTHIASYILLVVSLMLILLVLRFGRSLFTFFLGLSFGGLFLLVAWMARPAWSVFLLLLVATLGGFISLDNIEELGRILNSSQNDGGDDASRMAALFGRWSLLSWPMFWVVSWFLIAIFLIAGAFWFTWLRARPG